MTLPYDVQNPLQFVGQQTPRYSSSLPMQPFAESFGNAWEAIGQHQPKSIYSYQPNFDDDCGADEMRSTCLRNDQRLDLRACDDFRNDDCRDESHLQDGIQNVSGLNLSQSTIKNFSPETKDYNCKVLHNQGRIWTLKHYKTPTRDITGM